MASLYLKLSIAYRAITSCIPYLGTVNIAPPLQLRHQELLMSDFATIATESHFVSRVTLTQFRRIKT
jgi:hypothetical protein